MSQRTHLARSSLTHSLVAYFGARDSSVEDSCFIEAKTGLHWATWVYFDQVVPLITSFLDAASCSSR
ncbi:hypothetical protein MES5069_190013 [Mesorhizobium escarrei]|uniref:Uncharacterized protein n=1 Tax=Mesorhizobium escarrei TaxID=666018 RepID=A0ABN8JKZ7_9HYPH|nr:hypothetical protein MES5069_190013 [Mesorhizobium escarrei]